MENARLLALSGAISRGRRHQRVQMRLAAIIRQMFECRHGTASVEFAIIAAAVVPPAVLGGYELGPVLHDYVLQLIAATKDACAAIESGGGQC